VTADRSSGVAPGSGRERAGWIIAALTQRGETLGVAESLTGGLLSAVLTSVPGASVVVRGGVIAYATDVKASMLGVPPELLEQAGPVDPRVAAAMARGARQVLSAEHGVATTGEAGPESASGQPVGTVHVAVSGPQGDIAATIQAAGGRAQVRAAAVEAALRLLARSIG
jgi:nicotinamide-nucleotide amidase